jgi:hypothetical protein
MRPDSGSRALGAANDLVELLRLAQGASERIQQEVHGPAFDEADQIARELQRLRRRVERLGQAVERFVGEESAAGLRRATL